MLTTATIDILSQLGATFTWTTTSTLGPISVCDVSTLNVKAELTTSTVNLKYLLKTGSLPNELKLNFDGSIQGKVFPFTTGPFPAITTTTFIVSVQDSTGYEYDSKTFSLISTQNTGTGFGFTNTPGYSTVYFKPYMSLEKRQEYNKFIQNKNIFLPNLIYRPYDLNFGIQKNIKMCLHFGVEHKLNEISEFILKENFSKRRIRLGNLKTAIAKEHNQPIYEIIYLEVLDDFNGSIINNTTSSFVFNGKSYYPPSINNMRNRFINNSSGVVTTEELNPKFTKTAQSNLIVPTGYISFVPICYCLPGKSSIIFKKIKDSKFQFNKINFELDRILIEAISGDTEYLLFKN